MTTLMTTTRTALGGNARPALAPRFGRADAAAHTCDAPFSTDLIAGRTIDAGAVEVCNDDATAHRHLRGDVPRRLLADRPARRDHPRPADPVPHPPEQARQPDPRRLRLRRRVRWLPGWARPSSRSRSTRSTGGVSLGDTVAIAAHAEVEDGERAEGAWGEGTRFVPRATGRCTSLMRSRRGLVGALRRAPSSSPAPPTMAILTVSPARARDLPGAGGGGRLPGCARHLPGMAVGWRDVSEHTVHPGLGAIQACQRHDRSVVVDRFGRRFFGSAHRGH